MHLAVNITEHEMCRRWSSLSSTDEFRARTKKTSEAGMVNAYTVYTIFYHDIFV